MSYDAKAMTEAVISMWNTGDTSGAAAYYLPDTVRRAPNQTGPLTGLAEVAEYVRQMRAAFPDARLTIDEIVAGEDCHVVRWTFTGTQQGEYLGLAASNKSMSVAGVTWVRVRDGKVVSEDAYFDNMTVLQALGALPGAAASA